MSDFLQNKIIEWMEKCERLKETKISWSKTLINFNL